MHFIPSLQRAPSMFPALGRQGSSEIGWPGVEKHSGYNPGLQQSTGSNAWLSFCVMLTHNSKSWELGQKSASTLLRWLIRKALEQLEY